MSPRQKRPNVDKSPESVDKSTGQDVEKSEPKSVRKRGGFMADPSKRGRGPKKGAPNAGRPPLAVKALAREILSRYELLERMGQIAAAQVTLPMPAKVGTVEVPPSFNEQIAATKLVLNYAEGMPTQSVEVTDMGVERKRVQLPAILDTWPPKLPD